MTDVKPWYKTSFRRHLLDMHIPDWHPDFLAKLDSGRYLALLEQAHVDTAMVYTGSCLGICYWPTPYGHMHAGLQGRDFIGEMVEGCREKGIHVILYYNFWSKWAYDTHPEWRFVSAKGEGTADYLWQPGRYGVCCLNSPYRDFLIRQVEDLASRYDAQGVWIDMIHWPYSVCYCGHCRKRYLAEAGEELPKRVDWHDPAWIRLQRARERWIAEFAEAITAAVKRIRPDMSVGHQCASWTVGWQNGLTNAFFRQTDYTSGDFYGDALFQSFTCKALYHLTENKPFEFMTSRSPDLTHHTTMKSPELLRAHAYAALSNHSAFLVIDAIDPAGTMDASVYETIGELYRELAPYAAYFRPDAASCQDVAIYMNFESEIDLADNGKPVMETSIEKKFIKSAMNAARALIEHHIPYGVITRKNIAELSRYQVLVLPDLAMMDDEEAEAVRQFVHAGGSLYASKRSSLIDKEGTRRGDFMLADVYGVNALGETEETVTYAAPVHAAERDGRFLRYSAQTPLTLLGTQMKVEALPDSKVIARLSLPYTHPDDASKCASAISNPPGTETGCAAIVEHRYGAGRCLYAAGSVEGMDSDEHRGIFARLIRSLAAQPFGFEAEAPKAVELTLFHDADEGRYLLHLLNFQKELPNIPVHRIPVRVRMNGKTPLEVRLASPELPLAFAIDGDFVRFEVPKLETYALCVVRYA
ncbi:beta-galactosidase trimerization domain-containing protein [Paenibacillus sp. MBLB4367]|uniref:beta-galactosidase trimerization domain-containing protein n=1 Tax=Paenibacillus sp. MBLB4367 TaxID=3384767 RepID=UPI003908019D